MTNTPQITPVNKPPTQVQPVVAKPVSTPIVAAQPTARRFTVTKVENALNGHNFRGVCTCGWQTHQVTQANTVAAMQEHVDHRH